MLEGIVFGFSVWWISYLLVWPLLTVIVMAMRKNGSPVIWAVLAGVYGLLFGPLMYLAYFTVVGGWNGFLPMWITESLMISSMQFRIFFTVLFL